MQTGHHMRACCAQTPGLLKIDRDATGNVTSMKGVSAEMLNWMAEAFDLTYECVNLPLNTFEKHRTILGAIFHAAQHNACDVIVGPVDFRYDRFQLMDYLHPWVTEPVQLLIPMPTFIGNSAALLEPFTFMVWMSILGSTLVTIVMLMLLDLFKGPPASSRPTCSHWFFVVGSLFGRAGLRTSNKSRIRILMITWLMGAIVLTGLYTTLLFGYIVTSFPVPVVNSAEELADKHEVNLVVVNGWTPELTITKSEFPLMKKLMKKLEDNVMTSRCPTVENCIEQVKKNNKPTVFINKNGPILLGMMDDFRKTGLCNFALSKKSFDNYHESWTIRKGDRHAEFYNRATMRMREAGLLNHWLDTYQPTPHKCFEMAKSKDDPRNSEKISLKNLKIPFAILFIGCVISFIVLICEKLVANLYLKTRAAVVV